MSESAMVATGWAAGLVLCVGLCYALVLLWVGRDWPKPSAWVSPFGRLPKRWCLRVLKEGK